MAASARGGRSRCRRSRTPAWRRRRARWVMTWSTRVMNGTMPVRGLAAAEHLGAVDVVGGQVGQRAAAVVLVVDPHRPGLRRGPGWGGSGSGPGWRSSRRGDDVLVGAQRCRRPRCGRTGPGRGLALARKSGSRMKIQDRYCQGLSASSASQRRTVDAEIDAHTPSLTAWRASSGAAVVGRPGVGSLRTPSFSVRPAVCDVSSAGVDIAVGGSQCSAVW